MLRQVTCRRILLEADELNDGELGECGEDRLAVASSFEDKVGFVPGLRHRPLVPVRLPRGAHGLQRQACWERAPCRHQGEGEGQASRNPLHESWCVIVSTRTSYCLHLEAHCPLLQEDQEARAWRAWASSPLCSTTSLVASTTSFRGIRAASARSPCKLAPNSSLRARDDELN